MKQMDLIAVISLLLGTTATFAAPPAALTPQIIIDQFGYRASAPRKVALFSNPVKGQNSADHFVPGATFQLRRQADDAVVLDAALVPWRKGAVDDVSGDQVWTADFSSINTPGEYYLFDPKNNARSIPFKIDDSVYNDVLKTAVRTYYYQRCGVDLTPDHAGKWTHAACLVGPHQTKDAAFSPPSDAPERKPRDVSGGWHDAGDYNKYMPFLATTLWNLLSAYDENPTVFPDNYNIPESGNGVPDILNEVKWELDWMLKMQMPDGSVCNRVAEAAYNDGTRPEEDIQPIYVTPPTTWATSTFAALTAHASKTFKPFDKVYPDYSTKLLAAAERSWKYLQGRAAMFPADGHDGAKMAAAGGDCDANDDARRRIFAAAELFCATGAGLYRDYFDAHYDDIAATNDGGSHPLKGMADSSRALELNEAFLDYAMSPGATPQVVAKVKPPFAHFAADVVLPAYRNADDPYLAYVWTGHYCWGSNQIKATWADLVLEAVRLDPQAKDNPLYRQLAEDYLHYFHGRNPLSLCYLTNMGSLGANLGPIRSVMRPYHGWFNNPLYSALDTKLGPAPGFLVGGPNASFSVDWMSPPHGEPAGKAFKDWNGAWNAAHNANEASWEITEPAIYYQAAYIHLLANFCRPAPATK